MDLLDNFVICNRKHDELDNTPHVVAGHLVIKNRYIERIKAKEREEKLTFGNHIALKSRITNYIAACETWQEICPIER